MGTHPIFESDFDCLTECSNGVALSKSLLHRARETGGRLHHWHRHRHVLPLSTRAAPVRRGTPLRRPDSKTRKFAPGTKYAHHFDCLGAGKLCAARHFATELAEGMSPTQVSAQICNWD